MSFPNGEQTSNRTHTDKELAKMAGVGTVSRYDTISIPHFEVIGIDRKV